MSADPSDEKANPQVMPDLPPSKGESKDDEPEIEDPELRSGHRFGVDRDESEPDR